MSERHREALAHLLYGLDAGGGFVLLTGEVGAGKTTVCRCFLEQIPQHCNVAYIFNPKLTVQELLHSICDEFGVPHKPTVPGGVETVKDYIDPLNASLLAAHGAGRNTVLIIDEAQNLSADVLEQLRLLTNLETSERKLLQIILIGQPELRAMVAQPAMEQLAQRVIARFHLGRSRRRRRTSTSPTAWRWRGSTARCRSTGAPSSACTSSRTASRGASTCCATGRCWAPTRRVRARSPRPS